MGTRTSSFGVGRREAHDARPFYERFAQPVLSTNTAVNPRPVKDRIFVGDARNSPAAGSVFQQVCMALPAPLPCAVISITDTSNAGDAES